MKGRPAKAIVSNYSPTYENDNHGESVTAVSLAFFRLRGRTENSEMSKLKSVSGLFLLLHVHMVQ